MANIKTTIGNQGVVSSQVAVGGTSTLDVTVPVNLIAASGSNLVTSTTSVTHLYISDINGSDSNSGTASTAPLKTFAAAVAKIPTVVKSDFVIHIGTHGGTGYTWETIDNCTLVDGASLYIYGDGAGQSGDDGFTTILASTAALASSTNAVVKNTGMTVDAYMGYTIEILTGAAAGDRRTIMENTATDIIPVMRFTAAVAENDTYRIIAPSVKFVLVPGATQPIASTILAVGLGDTISKVDSAPADLHTQRSALNLVNLQIGVAFSTPEFINCFVRYFGVLMGTINTISSGEMALGITTYTSLAGAGNSYVIADLPALLTSKTSWCGWGGSQLPSWSWVTSVGFHGPCHRYGTFVGVAITLGDGRFNFYGGRLKFKAASPTGGGISVGGNNGTRPFFQIGTYGLNSTSFLGVKVETSSRACISLLLGHLTCPNLGSTAPLTLISVTGTGIVVDYSSLCDMYSGHNFASGFSITTGGFGVSVKRGGKMMIDHDMFNNITATNGAFTLDELTGYNFSVGSQAGVSLFNAADGSSIVSVD